MTAWWLCMPGCGVSFRCLYEGVNISCRVSDCMLTHDVSVYVHDCTCTCPTCSNTRTAQTDVMVLHLSHLLMPLGAHYANCPWLLWDRSHQVCCCSCSPWFGATGPNSRHINWTFIFCMVMTFFSQQLECYMVVVLLRTSVWNYCGVAIICTVRHCSVQRNLWRTRTISGRLWLQGHRINRTRALVVSSGRQVYSIRTQVLKQQTSCWGHVSALFSYS